MFPFKLHPTTLNYTSLCLLTLHVFPFKLHPTKLHHTSLHFSTLQIFLFKLHPTTLHYTCRHFSSSHLNFTQLHFTTLSFTLTDKKSNYIWQRDLLVFLLWSSSVKVHISSVSSSSTAPVYRFSLHQYDTRNEALKAVARSHYYILVCLIPSIH
jgi:hypothetical protein